MCRSNICSIQHAFDFVVCADNICTLCVRSIADSIWLYTSVKSSDHIEIKLNDVGSK